MDKEQKKIIQRKLGFSALRLFVFINGLLPLHFSYILGSFLGRLAYVCVGRHRRVALEGLAVAFPRASLAQKRKIARDFFIFLAQGALEMFYFLRNPSALTQVTIKGKEHLDQALAQGSGVIMVTGHIGNFPLMSLKLVQAGYTVNFITARMRDEQAGNYLYTLRSNSGVKTIFSQPRRECVLEITKALRDNEIVIMQMDQNFGTGGVWVKFFGTLAATPTGPVTLGLRTHAAVVPAYIYREGEGKHSVRIFPQEKLVCLEDKDETVLRNVAQLTRIIETWVREYPAQWGWIHRRWKSRPSDKIARAKFKIES
ncbi:MAG: lysophospholipid acyltransferase family protein [Candidatus Omnitrophota bacterium]|nr:lysophospholipid acyltransferase family protein [Candidatus Omnitrophota bacterium]